VLNLVLVPQFLVFTTAVSCLLIDNKLLQFAKKKAILRPDIVGSEALCWQLITEVFNPFNIHHFYVQYSTTAFLFLIPFFVFLAFNKPHDCFKCLGKDPDRRYSIFQFNKFEREQRRISVDVRDKVNQRVANIG
jgi:hypothetical protein